MSGDDLTLTCPACGARFGVAAPAPDTQSVRIDCSVCGHTLSAEEMLNAMAASLNDLLEQARDRILGDDRGDKKSRH